jgi:RNA polymerase sigma-70 factor, ECF subfamily
MHASGDVADPSGSGGEVQDSGSARMVSRAVARAQAGDRDAFAFLYARFADTVCRYAHSIVNDNDEAEDVTQQVFAKLVRVIDKYEERDVPFLAWMYAVTRNVAVDHLRRQRPIPFEEIYGSQPGFEEAVVSDRAGELKDALATLPREQREVLILRHFAGLSPTEIAARIGKTEGSIHGLHHRGRRALTAELTSRGMAPSIARSMPPERPPLI